MRQRLSLLLLSVLLSAGFVVAALGTSPVAASPEDDYVGPYFGDGNLPPGCIEDLSRDNPENICYHGKAGLNTLDSPKVDIAVVVPASPTAERDLRIMKQAAASWDAGIHYLADEMGLGWLRDGVQFTITPHIIEAASGAQPSTYPLYDPEIVILATNPAGGIGIGIDPLGLGIIDEDGVPCHNIENPFSMDTWEGMPGYDGHHGEGGGYYVEDCGGAGGNVCFSVNGAIDPVPGTNDLFPLYDLVLHETGHCLTLGHVGDGAEGDWGVVPTNDIMAYDADPEGQSKCVSTLNVEAFASRMSSYLDINGDNAVDGADFLSLNDATGSGAMYQVQHPDDHLYASSTGSVWDCPQPDLGTVPGEPVDFYPEPAETSTPTLSVTSPADGATVAGTHAHVAGTVARESLESGTTTTSPTPAGGGTVLTGALPTAQPLEQPGGNSFTPADSTGGATTATRDRFTLAVAEPSDVTLTLAWPDGSDLDLYVTGAAQASAASTVNPEEVALHNVTGTLDIEVDPYLVVGVPSTTYTLEATIVPAGTGSGSDPVGVPADETVTVYVDGVEAGSQAVETSHEADAFAIDVAVPVGRHEVRTVWTQEGGEVLGSDVRTVLRPDPDGDTDGDGFSDAKEAKKGTDPYDADSYPRRR